MICEATVDPAEFLSTLDDLPKVAAGGPLDATNFDVTKHDATITIVSLTGAHRTFRIATVRRGNLKGRRIVSLLVGPEDWLGFGFADDFGVRVWERMRYESPLGFSKWEEFAKLLERPGVYARKGAVYMVSGRCRWCGRELTHPSSLMDSIGPECRRKG